MTRYQELQNAIRESNKGLHYLKQDHETLHVESLCSEIDQLRARVAELEKERTEWSVIYRRDYGHDWSTRGNYKGF